jgi:3-dehydroquinate synthetase
MPTAADYIDDVRRYDADATEDAVGKIVKHLGIALAGKDSSLVSASDPSELERVRESWCKRKLGLEHSDEDLDAAIASIMTVMKEDRNKQRVTVYYLLATHFGKIDDL